MSPMSEQMDSIVIHDAEGNRLAEIFLNDPIDTGVTIHALTRDGGGLSRTSIDRHGVVTQVG